MPHRLMILVCLSLCSCNKTGSCSLQKKLSISQNFITSHYYSFANDDMLMYRQYDMIDNSCKLICKIRIVDSYLELTSQNENLLCSTSTSRRLYRVYK